MSNLDEILEKRKSEGNLRSLRISKDLVDFCSNDYLGFARSSMLQSKIEEKLQTLDAMLGSTGSRLVSGNSEFAENLECKLASFHDGQAALLFNSGYDANLGVFSCIAKRQDTIIYDELSHASVRDGIRLSLSQSYSFRHNDLEDLEKKLKSAKGDIYIAVESVYSMDGDISPLAEIVSLSAKYSANLIVDEAHASGVFGSSGQGKVHELNLQDRVFARVHTFGKALGCHGAVVIGSESLRNYLINFARSFIYSTALPLHSLVVIESAYDFLPEAFSGKSSLREKLNYNLRLFANLVEDIEGMQVQPSAIQILIVGGNENARAKAASLQNKGFDVRAILSPTVPKGKERLRICLHAFNSEQEIVDLSNILRCK